MFQGVVVGLGVVAVIGAIVVPGPVTAPTGSQRWGLVSLLIATATLAVALPLASDDLHPLAAGGFPVAALIAFLRTKAWRASSAPTAGPHRP